MADRSSLASATNREAVSGGESSTDSQDELNREEKRIDNAAAAWKWEDDPYNPYNWPKWKKNVQLVMIASVAFSASVGTSIISPAHFQLIEEFGVSSTVSFLPFSMYVLALGLGPVFGGPLSETLGRRYVYIMGVVLGGLFAMGAGLAPTFASLTILRFLSGFFYGPSLAIGAGVVNEVYLPIERGPPSAIFILSPFLGPGLGPVLGVFLVTRKDWRWTQYTLSLFSVFCLLWVLVTGETYHTILMRRRMKQLGLEAPKKPSAAEMVNELATTGLFRPIHMLFTEPIVLFTSLFVSIMFGTLFMFFGAFFYVFQSTYKFSLEQTGLVFLAIAFGCLLGTATVGIADKLVYQPKARAAAPHHIAPEHRLYAAMIGSVMLPISLFWFGWTARADINPTVPIVAVVGFGWGNITLFISCIQYVSDTYHRNIVASAASANGLARYSLATVFPFFALQMYQNLGTGWATSILGFIALVLAPVPWVLFKYGAHIRSKSKYETASY